MGEGRNSALVTSFSPRHKETVKYLGLEGIPAVTRCTGHDGENPGNQRGIIHHMGTLQDLEGEEGWLFSEAN